MLLRFCMPDINLFVSNVFDAIKVLREYIQVQRVDHLATGGISGQELTT